MSRVAALLNVVFSILIPTRLDKGMIIIPLLGAMSGKLGSFVASRNRGGSYFRLFTSPVNPNSTRQQTMRTILGTLAGLWSTTLTPAQREAWNTWASTQAKTGALGQTVNWTGMNGYVSTNTRLIDAGDNRIDDPPVVVAPTGLLTASVDVSAANVADVTFTATPPAANHKLVMFMGLPQSGAAEPNFAQTRIVGYSAAAQASPWAASTPFSIQSGQKTVFFVGIMDDETGLFSSMLRAVDTADY